MKLFLVLISLILLSSCSSYFKRQSCESTNWFEYGEKVALEGRRLSGDQFILECNTAEADVDESGLDRGFKAGMQKYCLPETVYQTGRSGRFFTEEMCTGSGLNNLRTQHRVGVLEYCQKSNGYNAGAVGNPYNKICPVDLERAFLPEFNRGRKRYLATVVSQNNSQINELNSQMSKSLNEVSYKKGLRLGLEARLASNKANAELDQQVRGLNSEIYSLESSINATRSKIENLKSKNRQFEIEMVQLGN